jgi:hypothetical protein
MGEGIGMVRSLFLFSFGVLNPSCPPFAKGGTPLFEKEGLGEIFIG